jgi:hypothetical protein
MLEMRAVCERARGADEMKSRCPNCSGELLPRPARVA